MRSRWRRVDAAYYQAKNLPPVQLYKIGTVYFVRDGHHRVSVAREKGQEFIDAEVIEMVMVFFDRLKLPGVLHSLLDGRDAGIELLLVVK